MNANYSYLRFGAMPFQLTNSAVSPYRPLSLGKKMYKLEHAATQVTIAAGGEFECIFMEGYISGATSEPVALFYAVQPNQTSASPDRSSGNKKTITGKPTIADHATCYIGGFIKVTHVSGTGPCAFEGRYYEPLNLVYPANWADVINSGPSAIKSYTMTGDSMFISCMPTELKAKRFYQLNVPDFHRMSYHFKIKNNGTNDMIISITGNWWLETQEASGTSPVSFTQDTKCPYKLAEYVFGRLRNSKMYTLQSAATSDYANLDTAITTAISDVVMPWQALTSNLTLQYTTVAPVGPKVETDEEWAAKALIWNP